MKHLKPFNESEGKGFEESVIDPLLAIIKENQEYLIKPENMGQLAKLGYMYNTLWYAGRVCWGYDGYIEDGHDCEDNPKYKIEACDPISDEADNKIYDAWGMHVSNDMNFPAFEEFKKKIYEGRELSDFEKKLRKPNKTMDEWIAIKTDPQYRYSSLFDNKREIMNHLLCVIGTGNDLSPDGYIMEKASGAGQDRTSYGDWENAKFTGDILERVNQIMENPLVKQTLNENKKWQFEMGEKRLMAEMDENERLGFGRVSNKDRMKGLRAMLAKEAGEEAVKKLDDMQASRKEEYKTYYPICEYSIISKIHKGAKAHQSYIDASIEVCKDILEHQEEEMKEEYSNNVKFAKEFLTKRGIDISEYEESDEEAVEEGLRYIKKFPFTES